LLLDANEVSVVMATTIPNRLDTSLF